MVKCKGNSLCPIDRICCQKILNNNVNGAWKEYYKKYDLIQYSIATFSTASFWYQNIPKIPKEQIPIYEKEYLVYPQEFKGVPFLILRKKGTIVP